MKLETRQLHVHRVACRERTLYLGASTKSTEGEFALKLRVFSGEKRGGLIYVDNEQDTALGICTNQCGGNTRCRQEIRIVAVTEPACCTEGRCRGTRALDTKLHTIFLDALVVVIIPRRSRPLMRRS